jgi:hypothetical protein
MKQDKIVSNFDLVEKTKKCTIRPGEGVGRIGGASIDRGLEPRVK